MKKLLILLIIVITALTVSGQEMKTDTLQVKDKRFICISVPTKSINSYEIYINGKFYDSKYYGNNAPISFDLAELPKGKIEIITILENRKKHKFILWQ